MAVNIFTSHSPQETQNRADELLNHLKNNLICLYGDLGSGKTTFVRGLAKKLGIEKRIISPTFVLMREYNINNQISPPQSGQPWAENFKFFYHIDLYRTNSEQDIKGLDLKELWREPKNLIVIEWAEKINRILPPHRIDIKLEYLSEKERKIIVDAR